MNPELLVDVRAWEAATTAASIDPMTETGGVLLGWRHGGGVYVRDILLVAETRPRHTLYRRRHKPASDALQAVLASQPPGSPVGYVGEWHSHPAPTGPSWVDRREIRRISKRTPAAIGLLVCAFDARARTWTPVGAIAHQGRVVTADVVLRDACDADLDKTEPSP